MRELFSYWFSPKRAYSFIKIPIGTIIVVLFIPSLVYNFQDFIHVFRTEPVFTGFFLLLLPIFFLVFLADTIFFGGLFYLPYHTFEEEGEGWKALLKSIGILFGVFLLLRGIRFFVWGGF